jgi:rhamnosyl/mannosyltransferase
LVGGYETQLKLLVDHLSEYFKIKVLTFKLTPSKSFERLGNVSIYRLDPQLVFYRVPFSMDFMRMLRKLDFDILHANGLIPIVSDISVWYAHSIRKKPTLYTHHFDGNVQDSKNLKFLADSYNRTIGQLACAYSDVLVATSRSYAETSPLLGHLHDKVKIVPCMVDSGFFKPQSKASAEKIRRRHGLSGKKVVLFVGRIVPYKGLEYLLKAFARILETDSDFRLVVIGEPEGKLTSGNSSYFGKIGSEVGHLGLAQKVFFLGRVTADELPVYYTIADVLVLPSVMRGEAFGSVLLEALACGTPVVASSIPGVRDVLKGNQSVGCYVPPRDDGALAHAIAKMACKKGEVEEKCREFAVGNYSVEKIADEYLELYKSLK